MTKHHDVITQTSVKFDVSDVIIFDLGSTYMSLSMIRFNL